MRKMSALRNCYFVRNHRLTRHVLFYLSIGLLLLFTPYTTCQAEVLYQNVETGYEVRIEDDASLLSYDEISALADTMKPVTEYGNVAFKSVASNASDTSTFAQSFYKSNFGTDSGTVFVIDMDNRNIWIFSDGTVYRTITKSYANTITDNVYRYASDARYFDCANEAFQQIYTLLEGGRVMQPMKYISNALLAVIIALLLNFAWICYFSRLKSPTSKEVLRSLESHFTHGEPTAVFTHETKIYDPVSDSSSSSGSSSSSSGSSSSGGGGGHSF